MKPVLIDPRVFRPMPEQFRGALCYRCNKPQARWEFFVEHTDQEKEKGSAVSPVFICSSCILYDSPWGKRLAEDIAELIDATEVESGEKFLRAPDGRLLSDKDATRFMASVALTSRLVQLRAERLMPMIGEEDPSKEET